MDNNELAKETTEEEVVEIKNEENTQDSEYTYTEPDYELEEEAKEKKGMAIVGMILGILSVLCCWFPLVNLILAIVGLILSIVGKKKLSKKTLGTIGLVVSIIGLVLALFAMVAEAVALIFVLVNQ